MDNNNNHAGDNHPCIAYTANIAGYRLSSKRAWHQNKVLTYLILCFLILWSSLLNSSAFFLVSGRTRVASFRSRSRRLIFASSTRMGIALNLTLSLFADSTKFLSCCPIDLLSSLRNSSLSILEYIDFLGIVSRSYPLSYCAYKGLSYFLSSYV